MSKNKVGRPETRNCAYFPHHTETTPELKYLEDQYGAEGYRVYYRLYEFCTTSNDHLINLNNKYDELTFRNYINAPKEIVDDAIEYLVYRELIDPEMYDQKKIWMPNLVTKLRPCWKDRERCLPQKEGTEIVSRYRNSDRIEKNRIKQNKIKMNSSNTINDNSNSLLTAVRTDEEYQQLFTDLDVPKALKRLRLENPDYQHKDVINWLTHAEKNGFNAKKREIKRTKSGMLKAKCMKCGDTDSLQDKRGFNSMHHCGGELEPIFEGQKEVINEK